MSDRDSDKMRVGGVISGRIESKVFDGLHPVHLEVNNESYMHNVPAGAESHFRLLIVSEQFEGKSSVQRHQAVYAILADEVRNDIHALGLQTLTPSEWQADQERNESPECLGGSEAET